jgi:hypothetical protein
MNVQLTHFAGQNCSVDFFQALKVDNGIARQLFEGSIQWTVTVKHMSIWWYFGTQYSYLYRVVAFICLHIHPYTHNIRPFAICGGKIASCANFGLTALILPCQPSFHRHSTQHRVQGLWQIYTSNTWQLRCSLPGSALFSARICSLVIQ